MEDAGKTNTSFSAFGTICLALVTCESFVSDEIGKGWKGLSVDDSKLLLRRRNVGDWGTFLRLVAFSGGDAVWLLLMSPSGDGE